MTYRTVARRIHFQTDDGVEANSPELAATLVAEGHSDAPMVEHSSTHISEVEVFDRFGHSVGTFQFDENHHMVKRPLCTVKSVADDLWCDRVEGHVGNHNFMRVR